MQRYCILLGMVVGVVLCQEKDARALMWKAECYYHRLIGLSFLQDLLTKLCLAAKITELSKGKCTDQLC